MKIEIEIPEVTDEKSAREAIEILTTPVDQYRAEMLADEYNIRIRRELDTEAGETYYPKGTNVEDTELQYCYRTPDVDEAGNLIEGIWVSSSEMC